MRHTIVNVEINIIFANFCETNMTVKKKKVESFREFLTRSNYLILKD